jgi:hypothetical protein
MSMQAGLISSHFSCCKKKNLNFQDKMKENKTWQDRCQPHQSNGDTPELYSTAFSRRWLYNNTVVL